MQRFNQRIQKQITKREEKLKKLLDKFKNNDEYDCIVSGSGGKDSSTTVIT